MKNLLPALALLNLTAARAADRYEIPALLRTVLPANVQAFTVKNREPQFIVAQPNVGPRGLPLGASSVQSYKSLVRYIAKATPAQQRCFWILASGGRTCPAASVVKGWAQDVDRRSDLKALAAQIGRDHGLRVARDFLMDALPRQDDSGGDFERCVLTATRTPRFRDPESILHLDREARARIGIYFVAGYNHDRGVSAPVMDAAAANLRQLGFASERLIVGPASSSEVNAKMIREALEIRAPRVNDLIVVGLSKGVGDIAAFMATELPRASADLRRRLKTVVSLSGVVRDAFVPRWMAHESGPTVAILRTYMKQFLPKDHRDWDGLASMAKDHWSDYRPAPRAPLWISFPMIPESERGMPERKGALRLITRLVTPANDDYGPNDGLVETGGSILPPGTGMQQWIIRALGDHGLIDGTYADGSPVSPKFVRTKDNVQAGIELIDAFTRCFPQSGLRIAERDTKSAEASGRLPASK